MMAARPLCLGILLVLLHVCRSQDVHYYVSVAGLDSNNGSSIHTPLRTIPKAISLVQNSANKGKNLFIELMPGYHDLTSSLHIKQHSGSSLTIRSYNNQEVHVTGGRSIPASSVRPVTDQAILNALPASSRHAVRYVHLPDLNITQYGQIHQYGSGSRRFTQLEIFYNGQPFRLARWPNEGFINIAEIPDGKLGHRFKYNSTRPMAWKYLDDLWVYGFWIVAWSDRSFPVKTLDTHNMMVIFDNKTNIHQGLKTGHVENLQASHGGYFRFINVLSELDEPGEYYLDKKTGNVYFWLPTNDGNAKSADDIHVSMINTCIEIDAHVHNVKLSGFIVEACRDRGIHGHIVNNIQLENMEIRNTGDYGLYIDGDSRSVTVSKSVFHHTDGGIHLSGGDRVLLESSGHTVEDCTFYQYAWESGGGKQAVNMFGVGAYIRYNEISDAQGSAIEIGGNDHIIEYNNIHRVCWNVSSCGAIHSSIDPTYRGNKIRYNTIHDLRKIYPGNSNRAVVMDNLISSAEITNNVFYNNPEHIQIGGGRDFVISNNVMYNATYHSISVDDRGVRWNAHQLNSFHARLKRVPYTNALWKSRYPKLAAIQSANETYPIGNQIHKNIYYNTGLQPYFFGSHSVDVPEYFNITETGYSYGIGDHYDVTHGDFRLRCHAAQWANRVNFDQVVSPNDVGPRYDVGPPFHKIVHKTVRLTGSPSVCPTVAPNTHQPMPAYLPDGAGQTPLLTVFDEGCWLNVTKCSNDPEAVGTYRDMYGERFHNASDSEKACLQRAVQQWHFCGSKPDEMVTAVFGPTGATTFGGQGCYLARYGCPKHTGPVDGHVVPGTIYRDTGGEKNRNATYEGNCLARALDLWNYCGKHPNHPVTSIFRPTGATRTAGGGCWIQMEKCPKQPNLGTLFYDASGATNSHSDLIEGVCFTRAEYYWTLCGSDTHYPVTAQFRPTTQSATYP